MVEYIMKFQFIDGGSQLARRIIKMAYGSPEFKLCEIGWKLYDDWCVEEEGHTCGRTTARKAYIEHRKNCKECTPYVIHNSPMGDENEHKPA